MEQIIVKHPDASTTLLVSKGRTSSVTKAEQTVALLGADTVAITVKTATPINFYLGDQIEVYGKDYTLNQLPTVKKTGVRKFEYDLTFEGVQYELIDAQWLLPDNTILDSFTGDLADFLELLADNANRVFPGKWQPGTCPADTEFKTLTYTGSNCLEVLQNICDEYNTEFEIAQANGIRTINIKTAGVNFPYTFRYGRTGGLYELTRQNINSKNVVTRLYVYGGSNNLGNQYRYTKLCLSGKGKNASYIENAAAISAFGLKENTKTFDDVYPNRVGNITALGDNYRTFIDDTINFDLNEKKEDGITTKWLINGVKPKVKFNSGNLAGYEFECSYTHATHAVTIDVFSDENGMKFPSETSAAFQFGVGDKYIFTDINLPDAYKTEAEAKLQEEGETYYNQYCQPQVQYNLSIDQNFIKQFAGQLTVVNLFAVGDYIPVEDSDLGLAKSVRITGFTRDLLQPYKYSITLGDSVTKTTITRVIEDLQKIDTVIQINDLADPSKARRNWRAAQEVLANVFDPDGHYYSEKIKPLSIETTMLAVGAKSQQLTLQNTRFEPNYEGDPSVIKVIGGSLTHYTIEDTIKNWVLADNTTTGLVTNTAYYIYARCNRSNTSGNILFDTVQRTVDSNPLYYYFLIGTLSSVITDDGGKNPARLISLTYGASTINGRFIRTGRIESSGGTTYFDLDAGEIGGNIKFVASDGITKNVSDLDSVAQETNDYINNTLPVLLDDLSTQIDGKIDTWYQSTDPSTDWTTTELRAKHVGDMWFNSTANKLKRYSSSYAWVDITDQKAIDAYTAASTAQDTADGKRRVFVAQPYPPYDIGDLWVNGTDLRRCATQKAIGTEYSVNDWVMAVNYTDDSELQNFIENTYNTTIENIQSQLDGQIEQFFYGYDPTTSNEPANEWTTTTLKENHLGDLFYNTQSGAVFRWIKNGGVYYWQQLQDEEVAQALVLAQNALELAGSKRRIFGATPTTPYDIGDLWVQGTSGDIMHCIVARSTGNYVSSDWERASKYTDDSALNEFIDNDFTDTINTLTNQVDGKVETWFTSSDPADNWENEPEKSKHIDDIWYNTTASTLWHYTNVNGIFNWERITDQKAIDAYTAASTAQDTADGKRRVFVAQPYPPYDVGDLWVEGTEGDILYCTTAKASTQTYLRTDWAAASKYTDDSALNEFINGTYSDDISELTNQLDGKVESWFQDSDPSTDWTTAALKEKHAGDFWYSYSTKLLKRYTVTGWITIEDQKAIDAYTAASTAQDTADGKRQVFTDTPYPPYDVGDLWLRDWTDEGVDKKELYRCLTARNTGSYIANDWVVAVYYDNTQVAVDKGIVTAGTVQLANGNSASIVAGITGGDNESASETEERKVRIWSGASKENRFTAPFRVLQDGTAVMRQAKVTGEVNANSGSVGGFEIANGHIGSTSSGDSTSGQDLSLYNNFIKFADTYRWATIGTNVLPGSSGYVGVGRFTNKKPNSYSTNYGIHIEVTGGAYNIALSAIGDIVCKGMITSYPYATITPLANNCNIPGDATAGGLHTIIARFINSDSGIGLPARDSIANKLRISSSTPFAFKCSIICDHTSTKQGYIIGRNSILEINGNTFMDNNNYPYRLNQNGGYETGKQTIDKGDIDEFMLVWDGTSNYVAYLLNHRR